MITDTYKGRTAKFTKNGITYYAKLEKDDAQKLVYGDKKSTWSGYNAKINSIADGDVFELVENSKYKNSSNEQGKNKGIHKITDSWDYFDKEVSVDGKYYDVLINVRKNNNGEWVYDVNLTDNVKKNNTNEKGIAPIATKSVQKQAGIRSKASNTLNSNIAQNSNLSNLSNKKFQASRSGVKPEDVAKKTTEEIKDSAYPRKRNFDKAAKPYLKKNLAEFKEIFQNKKSSNYKMAALAVSYLTGYDVAHQNTLERFKRISDFNKLSDNVREYINANITDDAKRAKLLDQLARQKTDKGILDVAAKTHIESERIIRDDLLKELRQNLKDLRPNKISRELSMLKLEALSDTFTQEELDSMLSSNGFSTGAVRKMYGLLRKARASLEVMGDKETGGKLDIPVKITELARELDRKFNESLNPSDGSDVPPSMKVSVEDLAKLNQVLADVKNQSKEAMRNLIHDASNEAYTAQQKIIKEMGPVDEPIANSREEKRIGTYNRYGKPVNSFENLDLDNFSAEMGDTMNKFTHKAILEGQKTVEHYLAKGYGEVDDIIKSFGSDKTEGMSNLEKSFMSVDTTNKHKYDITRDEAMAIYALATDRETKNLINKHGGLTLSLGDKKGSDTFILNADKLKEIESRLTTREKEMVMRGKKLLAQTYLPALNDVYERLNGVPLRLLVDGTYLFSIGQFSDH